MSQLAADTFIRADQAGWGTSSDGNTWAHLVGNAGTLAIVSNEGTFTGSTNPVRMVLGAGAAVNLDLTVRVEATSTSDKFGLALRASQASSQVTDYRLDITGPTTLTLIKTVSATNTTLANATIAAWSASTFYWMRFRIVGSNLMGKWWQDGSTEPGAWMIFASDTSTPGAGQYGVFLSLNATGDTVSFDHFLATDLSTLSVGLRAVVATQITQSAGLRALVRTQQTLSAGLRALVRSQHSLTSTLRAPVRTQVTQSVGLRVVLRGISRVVVLRIVVRGVTRGLSLRAPVRTQITGSTGLRAPVKSQHTPSAQIRLVVVSQVGIAPYVTIVTFRDGVALVGGR